LRQTLQWSGEVAAQIPAQTLAEASTAAWQDYFLFNAWLAMLCLFPALPFWRRTKYHAPAAPQAVATSAGSAATSKRDPKL
jgi:hypothetical protein